MKKIEVLGNANDYASLVSVIRSCGLTLFNAENKQLSDYDNQESVYYAFSSKSIDGTNTLFENRICRKEDYIYLSVSLDRINIGCVMLYGANDAELKCAFRKIKTYINANYITAYDRIIRIGPGLYSDWMQKKISFPYIVFKARSFAVFLDELEIAELFDYIQKNAWTVRRDPEDIRTPNASVEIDQDFLIHSEGAKLSVYWVRRGRIKHYTIESEAVFVVPDRDKKSGKYRYRFLVDVRNGTENSVSIAAKQFDMLHAYFNDKGIETIDRQ